MEERINISRPAYDTAQLHAIYDKTPQNSTSWKDGAKHCQQKLKKTFTCTGNDVRETLLARVPIINTLRRYNVRNQLVGDVIGGLSVGVIHITQGIGFAILAGVPPIYGLYSSFWPCFLYMLFGTGSHVAMGSMALISIMIRTVVDREVALLALPAESSPENVTRSMLSVYLSDTTDSVTQQMLAPYSIETGYQFELNSSIMEVGSGNKTQGFDLNAYKVGVVMSLTLLIGIIQFVMGVLHLGVVSTFMSSPFIGGLTTGAAIHIVTSQLNFIFGISLPKHKGLFGQPLTWYDLIFLVPQIKPAEVIIAVICVIIIFSIRKLNDRFKDKMIAPIPPELVVVVIACLISHFVNLEARFGVKIIKHIPRGMIPPMVPSVDKWFFDYFTDALMISLISFSIAFSMGSLFGGKHDYKVDANQDLMAIGVCHGVGAFFGSFAGTAAPPRCITLDKTGATSQISGFIISIFLLLVIFLMGPLFAPLPKSIIGTIIIVAVLPLFLQFLNLRDLWRVNKYDFCTWLITWSTVTFLGISMGLLIGIVFSILTIIIQIYTSKGVLLTPIPETEIFIPSDSYIQSKQRKNVQVFQFQGNLTFVTTENFKSQLAKLTHGTFTSTTDLPNGITDKVRELQIFPDSNANTVDNTEKTDEDATTLLTEKASNFVVLDFSRTSYIDVMGVNALKKIQADFAKCNVEVVLACVSHGVMKTLEKAGGKWTSGETMRSYPSLVDAVTMCKEMVNESNLNHV